MPVKIKSPGGGGTGAPGAGGTGGKSGGKGKGGKGKRGKNKKKKKDKLKCGENGKYGDLQKKTGNGKFDRDHVPQKSALLDRARKYNGGRRLCGPQKSAVIKMAQACAIPKGVHKKYSKTYGGRGKKFRKADAKSPQKAAKRDTAAIKKGLDKQKVSKDCQKKYAKWATKMNAITPRQYDGMLKKAVETAK